LLDRQLFKGNTWVRSRLLLAGFSTRFLAASRISYTGILLKYVVGIQNSLPPPSRHFVVIDDSRRPPAVHPGTPRRRRPRRRPSPSFAARRVASAVVRCMPLTVTSHAGRPERNPHPRRRCPQPSSTAVFCRRRRPPSYLHVLDYIMSSDDEVGVVVSWEALPKASPLFASHK
jgi:hypothetical protein